MRNQRQQVIDSIRAKQDAARKDTWFTVIVGGLFILGIIILNLIIFAVMIAMVVYGLSFII